ncbi:wax ester/triacylglycerol synthase family O-acyltransferase [Rubrivivax gelatinosus]|nr:wax ester/triacylglycerol synthase family O-acyltransferase [Rubrivivax gelatinosus]
MRQLSGHEASFLYADTTHANANVTFVQIYDQSTAPGGTVRFKSILAHLAGRLHRSPVFRQRLLRVPLELDYPYWVEDEHFDLEYHVRHIALPKPGDWRQFCIQASRIHARALDLNRPLWELYVIEGLDSFTDLPPGSFAVLIKVHHAAVDVEGRHEIVDALHDLAAEPSRPEPPQPWFPERAPGPLKLLARGAFNTLLSPLSLAAPLLRLAPVAWTFAGDVVAPEQHAATRFNSVVSAHRVFDTRRFMVAEFERIRTLVPRATVTDAVLAVCAGGLRRYLAANGELPAADLEAIAPLAGTRPEPGADAPWQLVGLGTAIADPVARLRHIQRQGASARAGLRSRAARGLADLAEHVPAATLKLASRWLGLRTPELRRPLACCTVSSVGSPRQPLYLCGARLTYFSAILPIADGMGLVFAITEYDGRIVVSPTSCRELVPDPETFTQAVRDSFQEYLALADAGTAPVRPATRAASAAARPVPRPRAARTAATARPAAPDGRRRSTARPG